MPIQIITSRPSNVKAIAFDWDDTIFTGMRHWATIQTEIIANMWSHGGRPTPETVKSAGMFVHATKGLTDKERFQVALDTMAQKKRPPHDAQYYANGYYREIEEYVSSEMPKWRRNLDKYLVPGVIPMLDAISHKGREKYVVTANHILVKLNMVEQLGLSGYFQGVYGQGSIEFPEFSKIGALMALVQRHEGSGGKVAMIGDGKGDMRAAKAAGAYAIALSHDAKNWRELVDAGADAVLNNFYNNPAEILKGLNID